MFQRRELAEPRSRAFRRGAAIPQWRGRGTTRRSVRCRVLIGNGGKQAACLRPPNGQRAKLRGQGPRRYGSAARRMPAFEARDAGGVTPRKLR
jgi:hypothetical protein